jgi:hypothetical protein
MYCVLSTRTNNIDSDYASAHKGITLLCTCLLGILRQSTAFNADATTYPPATYSCPNSASSSSLTSRLPSVEWHPHQYRRQQSHDPTSSGVVLDLMHSNTIHLVFLPLLVSM